MCIRCEGARGGFVSGLRVSVGCVSGLRVPVVGVYQVWGCPWCVSIRCDGVRGGYISGVKVIMVGVYQL